MKQRTWQRRALALILALVLAVGDPGASLLSQADALQTPTTHSAANLISADVNTPPVQIPARALTPTRVPKLAKAPAPAKAPTPAKAPAQTPEHCPPKPQTGMPR